MYLITRKSMEKVIHFNYVKKASRFLRKIYEHLTIAEKKEVIQKLKEGLVKLEEELTQESFSSFVRDILYSTRG